MSLFEQAMDDWNDFQDQCNDDRYADLDEMEEDEEWEEEKINLTIKRNSNE